MTVNHIDHWFKVITPNRNPNAVVVEIPHASADIPDCVLSTLSVSPRSICRDADLYVDRLYSHAAETGATLLISTASRYAIDLNRSPTDVDSLSVRGFVGQDHPHGLIWRQTNEGYPALCRPLELHEYHERLERLYEPYHRTLKSLLDEKKEQFGYALLVSAHSMPSQQRTESGHLISLADLVLGTNNGRSSHSCILHTIEDAANSFGWSMARDFPYRGGFTTRHYGSPELGLHAIQIELARRLYMDEVTLQPTDRFEKAQDLCRQLISAIGRWTDAKRDKVCCR